MTNETQKIVDEYRQRNHTQQQAEAARFVRDHRGEGVPHVEFSVNGTPTFYVFHDGAKPFYCSCGAQSIDDCVCDAGYIRVELGDDGVSHVWPAV